MEVDERQCRKCGLVKNVTEFHKASVNTGGLRYHCRACRSDSAHQYRATHKQERNAYEKAWSVKNPEKKRAITKRAGDKIRYTLKHRLSRSVSAGICQSLLGRAKAGKQWQTLVGYDLNHLKKHLERQFLPGMSWENYGKYGWHIDHTISAFNFTLPGDIDFKRCWALKNLRPLWASDNLRKRNKIDKPFQPSLGMGG
jgi:hypothetical protein